MPNVRKPKAPLAAWIVDQRKRLGWKSEELAGRLDVAESTVRGWESGRSVSAESLVRLERAFGVQAPGTDEPGQSVDVAGLVSAMTAALLAQTQALTDLRADLARSRDDAQEERAAMTKMLADLGDELEALRESAGTGAIAAAPDRAGR